MLKPHCTMLVGEFVSWAIKCCICYIRLYAEQHETQHIVICSPDWVMTKAINLTDTYLIVTPHVRICRSFFVNIQAEFNYIRRQNINHARCCLIACGLRRGDICWWNSALHAIGIYVATLTHLPQDKMVAISQTIFSEAYSWNETFCIPIKNHWRLFLRVHLTITQQWFR